MGATDFPWGKFIIIFAVVIVLTILVIVAVVFVYTRIMSSGLVGTHYDVPILDAMNLKTLENTNPPSFVNNFPAIPYTLNVLTYDADTGTGTATLAWLEDLGLNEGVAVAEVNYAVTDAGYGLTLSDFRYLQYVGREPANMPQGPFYLALTDAGIQLTGHYTGVTEMLV
jgi:hypothetical protein